MTYLGVDQCKAGWIALELDDDGRITGRLVAALTELPGWFPAAEVIAIDIPIGAPLKGGRLADLLARAELGPRRSSVFNTPVRDALHASTHAEATALSVQLSGKGLSQQSFALAPKILEADEFARTSVVPVFEVHPEVSFRHLLGAPAAHGKKSWAGVHQRFTGLTAAGVHVPDFVDAGGSVPPDDVLDAAVAAWSARRIHNGVAICYPDPPEQLDGHPDGVAIWA